MDKKSIWGKDRGKTDSKEAVSKKLDLPTIVFDGLTSVRKALENQSPTFLSGVESIECLIWPYRNYEYNSDVETINDNFNKALDRIRMLPKQDQGMMLQEARWEKAMLKFKALSDLCYNIKFYPVLLKEFRGGHDTDPLTKALRNLVFKQNRHGLILVTGGTGTGKSYVALKIAKNIDPTFTSDNLEERLIFKAEDFGTAVSNDKLKKGSVLIFDEAGVGIGARDFQTISNKVISKIIQTMRFRNLIVILTVPNMEWIDTIARKSIHFWIKTQSIDFEAKSTKVKILKLQYSERFKILYEHFLKDDKGKKFDPVWYDLIEDKKLLKKYEVMSQKFKMDVATSGSKKIAEIIEKKEVSVTEHNANEVEELFIKLKPEIDDMARERAGRKYIPVPAVRDRVKGISIEQAKLVKYKLEEYIKRRPTSTLIDIGDAQREKSPS